MKQHKKYRAFYRALQPWIMTSFLISDGNRYSVGNWVRRSYRNCVNRYVRQHWRDFTHA